MFSEKEEVVHAGHVGVRLVMSSVLLERALLSWFRLLLGRHLSVSLVELGPADGARIVLLEPGFDAASVEGVIARQLAARLAIGALLQANVAVNFPAFFLLGQVLDVVGRAALMTLSLLLLSSAAQEGTKCAVS